MVFWSSQESSDARRRAVTWGDETQFSIYRCLANAVSDAFQRGREFEAIHDHHVYTEEEIEKLEGNSSTQYFPVQNKRRKRQQAAVDRLDRWPLSGIDRTLMFVLVGVVVGAVGFLLRSFLHVLGSVRLDIFQTFATSGNSGGLLAVALGWGIFFTILAAALPALVARAAMGSGIPELVAYLNGANIKKIFNVKTFMARFFSCLFAVSSGLPVGPEAPMIALGSIVGANLPFGRSETLGFDVYDWHFFAQFRNIRDQRDFISAGAAAGVAAAFSSPIGGLIFSMEEVSLFWSVPLMIRIFVCAMAADFTANLLASTCGGFSCSALTGGGEFASFGSDSIIFRSWHSIDANLQMLPVAVIIGALGGSLGALFTFCNLKIQRQRMVWHAYAEKSLSRPFHIFLTILEPCVIIVIWTLLFVLIPLSQSDVNCAQANAPTAVLKQHNHGTHFDLFTYGCSQSLPSNTTASSNVTGNMTGRLLQQHSSSSGTSHLAGGSNGEQKVNSASLLFLNSGHGAVSALFQRQVPTKFSFLTLLTMLITYTPLACISAGSPVSSGLVVPMFLIGGCLGRMVGLILYNIATLQPATGHPEWRDPGMFALIGAAGFSGGVSRLTVALSIILIETTDDVELLLPIMIAILVAKWVADRYTHSLYHALIEMKAYHFLPPEPASMFTHNLDMHHVSDIMNSPVICINVNESPQSIARKLLHYRHNAFPVVADAKERHGSVVWVGGMLTRAHLLIALKDYVAASKNGANKAASSGVSVGAAASSAAGAGTDVETGNEGNEDRELLRKVNVVDMYSDDASPEALVMLQELVDEVGAAGSFKLQGRKHRLSKKFWNVRESWLLRTSCLLVVLIFLAFTHQTATHQSTSVMDSSAISVFPSFTIHRTLVLFRSLGLRHLPVVDENGKPIGILTRKDLMDFNLHQKLARKEQARSRPWAHSGRTELSRDDSDSLSSVGRGVRRSLSAPLGKNFSKTLTPLSRLHEQGSSHGSSGTKELAIYQSKTIGKLKKAKK